MEIENLFDDSSKKSKSNSSIQTKKFIQGYFSCFYCHEVREMPYILKCDHVYCECCLNEYNMKKDNGSIECPFCSVITRPEEKIPETRIKILIRNLSSINDEEFEDKYKGKLNYIYGNKNNNNSYNNGYNNENKKLFDVIKALLGLNVIFQKSKNKSFFQNKKKYIKKRNYIEMNFSSSDGNKNLKSNGLYDISNVFQSQKKLKTH